MESHHGVKVMLTALIIHSGQHMIGVKGALQLVKQTYGSIRSQC
jgi:hypothetical protein